MNTRGIGGIGGDPLQDAQDPPDGEPIEDTTRMVPRHVSASVMAVDQALAAIRAEMVLIWEGIAEIRDRVSVIDPAVGQLQGQAAEIGMVLPQYAQALSAVDARITGVAQQVARNVRFAAIDLAARTKGPGESAAAIIKNADAYLQYVTMPPPAPLPTLDEGDAQQPGEAVH